MTAPLSVAEQIRDFLTSLRALGVPREALDLLLEARIALAHQPVEAAPRAPDDARGRAYLEARQGPAAHA